MDRMENGWLDEMDTMNLDPFDFQTSLDFMQPNDVYMPDESAFQPHDPFLHDSAQGKNTLDEILFPDVNSNSIDVNEANLGNFAIQPVRSESLIPTDFPMNIQSVSKVGSSPTEPKEPPHPKRAKKADTINSKTWKPYEAVVRQLWQKEKKSSSYIIQFLEEKYGLKVNERQLQAQIKRMGIERNVKAASRKAIVSQVWKRKLRGKSTNCIRVNGIRVEKHLLRWAKDLGINLANMTFLSAPPTTVSIPSNITLKTRSTTLQQAPRQHAPIALESHRTTEGLHFNATEADGMERILSFAQVDNPRRFTMTGSAVRSAFNYIQSFLRSEYAPPAVESDITYLRGLMNLRTKLLVDLNLHEIHHPICSFESMTMTQPGPQKFRFATWCTPHAKVQAVFWNCKSSTNINSGDTITISTHTGGLIARLVFLPNKRKPPFFCISLDLGFSSLKLSPKMILTYQPIVSSDSQVFRAVRSGDVTMLKQLVESGTASLTDRDQQGRSLLNYAYYYTQLEMCKFLVKYGADFNAFERSLIPGYYSDCIFACDYVLDNELPDGRLQKKESCFTFLRDSGINVSYIGYQKDGFARSTLAAIVADPIFEALGYLMDDGLPLRERRIFSHPFRDHILILLAEYSGYCYGNATDILKKTILLLRGHADISVRDCVGNTVLHTLLSCETRGLQCSEEWKDHLMALLTVGADVCALNDLGESPSMIASKHDRLDSWKEALQYCGFDSEKVIADVASANEYHERQSSKLSFEDWLRDWRQSGRPEEYRKPSRSNLYDDYEKEQNDISNDGDEILRENKINDMSDFCDAPDNFEQYNTAKETKIGGQALHQSEIAVDQFGAPMIDFKQHWTTHDRDAMKHGFFQGLQSPEFNGEIAEQKITTQLKERYDGESYFPFDLEEHDFWNEGLEFDWSVEMMEVMGHEFSGEMDPMVDSFGTAGSSRPVGAHDFDVTGTDSANNDPDAGDWVF